MKFMGKITSIILLSAGTLVAASGAIMFGVCGSVTYQWTNIAGKMADGDIRAVDGANAKIENFGIGWLNFNKDAKALGNQVKDFNDLKEYMTSETGINQNKALKKQAETMLATNPAEDVKVALRCVLSLVDAFMATGTMFNVAIAGIVALSVGALVAAGGIAMIMKKGSSSKA